MNMTTPQPTTGDNNYLAHFWDVFSIEYRKIEAEDIPQQFLYHYTTCGGLEGIIRNKCLWATSSYYLNDSSELEYGCELFAGILREQVGLMKADNSLETEIITLVESHVNTPKPAFPYVSLSGLDRILPRVYLTCFCEQHDILSQWRAYGQVGGYSIQFDTLGLRELEVDGGAYFSKLSKVIYDSARQCEILRNLLIATRAVVRHPNFISHCSALEPSECEQFKYKVSWLILEAALFEIMRFKNPAFKEEQEWRLIAKPKSYIERTQELEVLKFRQARGILTPYIELKTKKNLLPTNTIFYGPTLEKREVQHSLRLFGWQHGYHFSIHGSKTPVRF